MSPARRGKVPDYAATHRRLRRMRGSATAQSCAECSATARCWCYDGTDPDEQRDPVSGRRYSLDPSRYRPRCASCHRTIAGGAGRLAPAVIDEAAALYVAGAGLARIAAQLDTNRRAVRTALALRGVEIHPPRSHTAVQIDGERAAELYAAGVSLHRIAAQLGVTRPAVRAELAERGVEIRPPRSKAAAAVDAERAGALYAAGASLRGIAAQLGVTRPAVRAALIRAGVAIRPPGPTRRHLRERATTTVARPRVIFQPFPTISRQPSRPPNP